MVEWGDLKKAFVFRKKRNRIPDGLWIQCKKCSQMVFKKNVAGAGNVCPECQFHFPVTAPERVGQLLDADSFEELWGDMKTADPLNFVAPNNNYREKFARAAKKAGMNEAVLTGRGTLKGMPVTIGVMDFRVMGASMGSVVGEKITRVIEMATAERCPVIVVCASGGARMHEGILSLMQMAKTSAAIARHGRAGLPYISILTNPTYAGVAASFAFLGDAIIAEQGSMIGFAGPRVIQNTIKQDLPAGFQTAEFLLEKGFLDAVVHRRDLRDMLADMLAIMMKRPALAKKENPVPENVQ